MIVIDERGGLKLTFDSNHGGDSVLQTQNIAIYRNILKTRHWIRLVLKPVPSALKDSLIALQSGLHTLALSAKEFMTLYYSVCTAD
jgi:hypothetical protein